MRPLKIHPGEHFGRITAKEPAGSIGGHTSWYCVCECGEPLTCRASSLLNGKTKSCGCLKNDTTSDRTTTHGLSNSVTYRKWIGMKSRCSERVTGKGRENYLLRGITFCERWNSFENFLTDMGVCPEGHELDREDNDKGYSPENCRWVTRPVNQANRRNSLNIEFNGTTKPLKEWSVETGIQYQTLVTRLKAGWPVAQAFSKKPTYTRRAA